MTLHIGPDNVRIVAPAELAQIHSDFSKVTIPRKPGLLTEKSLCRNATVITVGRGLRGDICQKCGKPHDPPRLK